MATTLSCSWHVLCSGRRFCAMLRFRVLSLHGPQSTTAPGYCFACDSITRTVRNRNATHADASSSLQLMKDLSPWMNDVGITKEVFEKTRTYNIDAGRMNHYQVCARCPLKSHAPRPREGMQLPWIIYRRPHNRSSAGSCSARVAVPRALDAFPFMLAARASSTRCSTCWRIPTAMTERPSAGVPASCRAAPDHVRGHVWCAMHRELQRYICHVTCRPKRGKKKKTGLEIPNMEFVLNVNDKPQASVMHLLTSVEQKAPNICAAQ